MNPDPTATPTALRGYDAKRRRPARDMRAFQAVLLVVLLLIGALAFAMTRWSADVRSGGRPRSRRSRRRRRKS